ncbi:MAG: PQQ-dependent sugar dehydrogenase [Burkholderiaceae bacterium]
MQNRNLGHIAGRLVALALLLAGESYTPLSAAPLETRPPNNRDFAPAFEAQTRAPAMGNPVELRVQTIARGLNGAWAVALLPDGRFLITERPGALRIIDATGRVSEPIPGLPPVYARGQGGLLDVALDPLFAANRTIYWSYSEPRPDGNGTALARGVLREGPDGARITDVAVLFRQTPSIASSLHFGSRIVFTPDGRQLYLTLGDRGIREARVQAQDLNGHLGKIVRIDKDGAVPDDNPFVGRQGARPEVWSYGHRNIQAAALDERGRLWTIEHGPRGGDELNRPEPGKNYGWPVIGYGIDYSGADMHASARQQGMEQPVYYWDPVIAPSGMIFHSGRLVPAWQGDVFVGGLGSRRLVRLKLEGDRVVGEEWLLQDLGARIRDVREAPDGALVVLTDGPNGALLRVAPAGS